MTVRLASNPSHLEYVNPVVEGETRAIQTDHKVPEVDHDPKRALAVLIHGDAAFPGQGVVAETLNLENLPGYSTGGTLHLIANNQIGFTTDPEEARSTRYSSDLAKGFDIPIVHVNADDAEAAVFSIRLAMAYRERFRKDFVVDLVGYRRFGHNEGDEPGYTQPLMYKTIESHPSLREQYAARLVEESVVTEEQAAELDEAVQSAMRQAHEQLKASIEAGTRAAAEGEGAARPRLRRPDRDGRGRRDPPRAERAAPRGARGLHRPSEAREAARAAPGDLRRGRRDRLGAGRGPRASGASSSPARPIRLTGQDTERGTFSHRHLVLHDYETGGRLHAAGPPPGGLGSRAGLQLAALRGGRRRLRVRLLGGLPGRARPLGGPVRRLRQLRPGAWSTSSSSPASRSGTRARG